MVLRQAASKLMIPGMERDLSKAMTYARRVKFAVKPHDFKSPAVTDGPLGKAIQAASPLRRATEAPKGLFR
jgi:hypothetical protein